MASSDTTTQHASEASTFPQRRQLPAFLPLMITLSIPAAAAAAAAAPSSDQDGDASTPSTDLPEPASRDRVVLIDPFIQTMVVLSGMNSDPGTRRGRPPASKESIRAMESMVIGEVEGGEDQCAVCLEEWGVGDVAKVMPCKHRFHGECIEKWLGVQGSCPVCRYEMPVEEEEDGKKREEEGDGGVWVSFSLDFGGRTGVVGGVAGGNSESNPSESGDDSSAAVPPVSGQDSVL